MRIWQKLLLSTLALAVASGLLMLVGVLAWAWVRGRLQG